MMTIGNAVPSVPNRRELLLTYAAGADADFAEHIGRFDAASGALLAGQPVVTYGSQILVVGEHVLCARLDDTDALELRRLDDLSVAATAPLPASPFVPNRLHAAGHAARVVHLDYDATLTVFDVDAPDGGASRR
jgi:hypothetical protein